LDYSGLNYNPQSHQESPSLGFKRCTPLEPTKQGRLYLQLPAFIKSLHEAARDVEDFAVDLLEVLAKRNRRKGD